MNLKSLNAIFDLDVISNDDVLNIVAQLPADYLTRPLSPSHETIGKLLVHMLGGEVYYLAQCQGREIDMTWYDSGEQHPVEAIRQRWEQNNRETRAFLAAQTDASIAREVIIAFGEFSFCLPLWQWLVTTWTHCIHHRGELSVLLTQLGHPLPDSDLMVHFIKASGQSWPF